MNIPTAAKSFSLNRSVQAAFITASKWSLIIYVRRGITTSARVEAFSASTDIMAKATLGARHVFHSERNVRRLYWRYIKPAGWSF